MTIQLPPNSTGTVLDTRTFGGADRQVVHTYERGAPGGHASSRTASGELLFVDDFRHPMPSYWNDGVGSATRDNDVSFCGLPSLRLDPQGQTFTAVTLSTPTGLAVTPVASGGTFAAGTYFWKVVATNPVGKTVGSSEVSAAIALNGSASVTWTAVAGATGYEVYRSTTTGTETFIATAATNSYTDTGTTTTGAAIPSSNTTGAPGRTAATTGVVAKRRVLDPFTGRFGVEAWFRMTSQNVNTTTVFPVMALYNRDGSQAYHGRVWLAPMGNNQPMQAWILDGAATQAANPSNPLSGSVSGVWRSVATSTNQNGAGSHTYDPPNGALDRAGAWHHCKLVVDLKNSKYVSVQLDGGAVVDLSAYSLDVTTTTGAAMMHFSFEFAATTSTRRFINVARVIGTAE
jgi:hypothetical protein